MPRIRAASIAEHKELTRGTLLDAAFRLFLAGGFARTSLTDVASLAGVGRTTLYEYFPNKQELFLTLIEERVPSVLEAAVAAIPEGPPGERIQRLFEESFSLLGRHVELGFMLFVVGRELPHAARERMWQALAPMSDELRRECERGIEDGHFAEDDVSLLHQSVADLLVGAVDQVLGRGYTEESAEAVLQARLRFLRGGLTAAARAS